LPKHVIHQSFVEGLQWSDEGVDLVKDLIEPPKEFDPPDPAFWTENLKLRNVLGVSDTQLTYAFRKIKDNILINVDYTHYQYKGVTRLYWSQSGIEILKGFLSKKRIGRPKKVELELKTLKQPKPKKEFKPKLSKIPKSPKAPKPKEETNLRKTIIPKNPHVPHKNKMQIIVEQRAVAIKKYLDRGYTRERAILRAMNDYPDVDSRDSLNQTLQIM
jgi:hypothetical protein